MSWLNTIADLPVNWVDTVAAILLVLYTVGGFYSGMIRRVIGVGAFLLGLGFATKLGLTAGDFVRQQTFINYADARMVGYIGFIVMVAGLIELLALFNHDRLQLSVVGFDRLSGAVVGAFTAVLVIALGFLLVSGYAHPGAGSGAPSEAQTKVNGWLETSQLAKPISNAMGAPAYQFLRQILPDDAQRYFTAPNPPPPS